MNRIDQNNCPEIPLNIRIESRIYNPIVNEFFRRFMEEELYTEELSFASMLSREAREALLLTLETHVHKEKPLFSYLIATRYGLDKKRARNIAISIDILWMLSLIFDDMQDEDETRSGMPTVWKKFGRDRTFELAPEILQACFRMIRLTCGITVESEFQNSVSNSLAANLTQTNINLADTTTDNILASYDQRNDFSGALGIRAISKILTADLFSQTDSNQLLRGIRALNRGSQLINDLKDLNDSYHRGFSDVKNGVTTVPLLLLYSSLSNSERSVFLSLFGNKQELTPTQTDLLLQYSKKTQVFSNVIKIIDANYAEAEACLVPGLMPKDQYLVQQWIKYKQEYLK